VDNNCQIVCCSGSVNCDLFLKEILKNIGGKGGGRQDFAEGRLEKDFTICKEKLFQLLDIRLSSPNV
jgi:alanyl-tRNA synthetase